MDESSTDALVVYDEKETALVLAEEAPEAVPELEQPAINGASSAWLFGSTLAFAVSVFTPVFLLYGVLKLLIVYLASIFLLFPTLEMAEKTSWGMGVTMGLALSGVLFLVGAVRHSMLDEEGRAGVSARRRILTVMLFGLVPLNGIFWLAQPETGWLTLASILMMANLVTVVLWHFWFAGQNSFEVMVGMLKRLRHTPFVAGLWTMLSSLMSAASMIAVVFFWSFLTPQMEKMQQNGGFEPWLDAWMSSLDASTSTGGRVDQGTIQEQRANACFETLAAKPVPTMSPRQRSIRWLKARHVSYADAEDITQTVLLKVCTKARTQPIDSLPPYFHQSVRNTFRNYKKHSWSRRCELNHGMMPIYESPDYVNVLNVKKAMCQLSEEYQLVLTLAGEGKNDREIAQALGIERSAARKRLSRARKELKYQMER